MGYEIEYNDAYSAFNIRQLPIAQYEGMLERFCDFSLTWVSKLLLLKDYVSRLVSLKFSTVSMVTMIQYNTFLLHSKYNRVYFLTIVV